MILGMSIDALYFPYELPEIPLWSTIGTSPPFCELQEVLPLAPCYDKRVPVLMPIFFVTPTQSCCSPYAYL